MIHTPMSIVTKRHFQYVFLVILYKLFLTGKKRVQHFPFFSQKIDKIMRIT